MLKIPARLACLSAALWALSLAQADQPPAQDKVDFVASEWQMADDSVLDTVRGGFEVSAGNPGLAISFGFVRSVSINGELVSQTAFSLPDLSRISVEQARQVNDALAEARLVQIGTGNSVGSGMAGEGPLAGLAATSVVQNSLNNQNIRTLTQIDAGVNSLGILRSINSQGVLQDALMGAVGLR